MKQVCQQLLLAWYDEKARVLPWRGIQDPYRTWVSETMLQQTRVETVLGYYARFLQRFPTIQSLAAAPLDDVLKIWEGLGYYSRARNLHRGAQQVVNEYECKIPDNPEELMKISGIGPYTAGAISSIAFGRQVPAVDGNVIRVVSRLCGIRENVGIPSVKRLLERQAAALVPPERPGDFNQALMDLGSAVCVPGTPACERCPLTGCCDAYAEGDADELPVLPRKSPPRQLAYDVCLIFRGDRVLMRQRTETMLNGLWVYPMLEGNLSADKIPAAVKKSWKLRITGVSEAGEARHVFTHQVWNMRLFAMHAEADAQAPVGMRFVTADEMAELAVPTAMKAALNAVIRLIG